MINQKYPNDDRIEHVKFQICKNDQSYYFKNLKHNVVQFQPLNIKLEIFKAICFLKIEYCKKQKIIGRN